MATAIVSGRVDARVKERADRSIKAAGTTVGDVIRTVWEHIARTGEVPHASPENADGADAAWDALLAVREELSHCPASDDPLAALTDDQLHDMKARDLLERYAER